MSISSRVAKAEKRQQKGQNLAYPVIEKYFSNCDHIPFCRDVSRIYFWGKKGPSKKREFSGKVGIGKVQNDRFFVKFTATKDDTKLIHCVIFKGVPLVGRKEHRRRSV